LKNAKEKKIKYVVEMGKIKWWIFGREKIKKCKWWKKSGKIQYEITTGLMSR
jgi:hypothetical protein